jgi:hypothetical protein
MRRSIALTVVLCAAAAFTASPAQAATTCTWGGTFSEPTGTFTVTPGITNLPATQPLDFVARGVLGGGRKCRGTMTWVGKIPAGSNCLVATFEGRVYGLQGVYSFSGRGGLDVPSQLYDRGGRLVGQENAEIATPFNLPHLTDCTTPEGFTGGWPDMFSSVVVVF